MPEQQIDPESKEIKIKTEAGPARTLATFTMLWRRNHLMRGATITAAWFPPYKDDPENLVEIRLHSDRFYLDEWPLVEELQAMAVAQARHWEAEAKGEPAAEQERG